jgi:hypothetical protein
VNPLRDRVWLTLARAGTDGCLTRRLARDDAVRAVHETLPHPPTLRKLMSDRIWDRFLATQFTSPTA